MISDPAEYAKAQEKLRLLEERIGAVATGVTDRFQRLY
jgi:tetrahydromethanopterin S-methyltransferase subunit G